MSGDVVVHSEPDFGSQLDPRHLNLLYGPIKYLSEWVDFHGGDRAGRAIEKIRRENNIKMAVLGMTSLVSLLVSLMLGQLLKVLGSFFTFTKWGQLLLTSYSCPEGSAWPCIQRGLAYCPAQSKRSVNLGFYCNVKCEGGSRGPGFCSGSQEPGKNCYYSQPHLSLKLRLRGAQGTRTFALWHLHPSSCLGVFHIDRATSWLDSTFKENSLYSQKTCDSKCVWISPTPTSYLLTPTGRPKNQFWLWLPWARADFTG